MLELNMERAANDDILALERYRKTKARIQNDNAENTVALYLNCMESWNAISGYLPWQEKEKSIMGMHRYIIISEEFMENREMA